MKILCLAIFVLMSLGCSMLSDMKYSEMLGSAEIYYGDFGEIRNYIDIAVWIRQNITYKKTESAQSPEATIGLKSGDCVDISILFMNIAYTELEIKMSLIAVMQRTIVDGGLANHAEVYYGGVCYGIYTGVPHNISIGYIYGFDEVFK